MKINKSNYESFKSLINEHIKETNTDKPYSVRPRLKFDFNGVEYSVSIQASYGAYSEPRKDNCDYYREVELGFPNFLFSERFINTYAECCVEPKESVYLYVPVDGLAKELSELFGVV